MNSAHELETSILKTLSEKGQSKASEVSGISETRLSRFKGDCKNGGGLSLGEFAKVLHALGMTVFDASSTEVVTVRREELEALKVLARRALG